MPRYLIERNLPGAGDLSDEQVHDIAATSNGVLAEMDGISWDHSYVTGDKITCVYDADSEDLVRQHASSGGFPADAVLEVRRTISPETGR